MRVKSYLAGLIAGFAIFPMASFAATGCSLTAAEKTANLTLDFTQFDQEGTLPSTARKLGERECYTEAYQATRHYLSAKPGLKAREINILVWHMGQYLASSGREAEAADILLVALRPSDDPPEPDGFDWNTYVIGSWAFLTRDKALLDQKAEALSKAPGVRNSYNAKALRRLKACFGKPYTVAYGQCQAD